MGKGRESHRQQAALGNEQKKWKKHFLGFPGGSVVKNLPANATDTSLISDPGRFHIPQSN